LPNKLSSLPKLSIHLWSISALLLIAFAGGGSGRDDVQSLVALYPVSLLLLGFGLWTLKLDHWRQHRALLSVAIAALLVLLVYLIPLPHALWGDLPQREKLAAVYQSAQLAPMPLPMAISPIGGWNTFFSLAAPLAVIVHGVQLDTTSRKLLVPLLIGLGLISGLVGLIQAIGGANSAAYFYRITNNGSAVGLFANRNHQALLLAMLFPMLGFYAAWNGQSRQSTRIWDWIMIAMGLVLVPLLLITGSRAGLLAGVIGLLLGAALHHRPSSQGASQRKWGLPILGVSLVALTFLTTLLSRGEAIRRLGETESGQDSRFVFWQPVAEIAADYLPFGSGPGSFAESYAAYEPVGLLDRTYLNHAHNDFLELYLTLGLAGVAVLALGIFVVARYLAATRHSMRKSERRLQMLGLCICLLIAIGSVGDYPLVTAIHLSIFAVALVWIFLVPGNGDSRQLGSLEQTV
jgi:uncharacterized membrane protein YhaH (DUF805 family)